MARRYVFPGKLVHTTIHEDLNKKITLMRQEFHKKNGIPLNNAEATRLLSLQLNRIKIPLLDQKKRGRKFDII